MSTAAGKTHKSEPLVPASKILPEITLKAIILSIIITIILGASDAYLALKIGSTVAASIPAAVIAMGIFRLFKKSNVLETNLVQTAASAGEGLAASASFILPALIILGFWKDFPFWEVVLISIVGGLLGVFFSVPLRKVLLNNKTLNFPEGTAVGNLLKVGATGTKQIKLLLHGIIGGGLISFAQTGLEIIADHLSMWTKKNSVVFGMNLGYNPVLLGIGYIVGWNVGLTMFIGVIIGWMIAIPILSHIYGIPAGITNPEDIAMSLWSHHLRYIGVGAMLVGAVWTLLTMMKPILTGFTYIFTALKKDQVKQKIIIPRTEQDMHFKYVTLGTILFLILSFIMLVFAIHNTHLPLTTSFIWSVALLGTLCIFVLGLFSSLTAGYIVGLIGSSNSPISGIYISNLLLLCLIFIPMMALHVNLSSPETQKAVIAIIIFILAIIGSAAIITNENIQDLKAGHMVGATPWKQQIMIMVGVIAAAVAIAPTLQLLYQAYGIGGMFPRPGMPAAQMLAAPQASLLAALSKGAIGGDLPWNMLFTGMVIGVVATIIDEVLKRDGKMRLPAIAIGIGIYLPSEISTTIFLGGLIRSFASKALRDKSKNTEADELVFAAQQRTGLVACGLVAGAALMGVILAIPFVILGNSDALKIVSDNFTPYTQILGIASIVALSFWLFKLSSKK